MTNKKQGFASVLVVLIILVLLGGGVYLYTKNKTQAPAPVANLETESPSDDEVKTIPNLVSGCDKNIVSYNRKDGSSISQKVALGGKDYEINSHIEAEDNWASFTVDGDIGPIGKYYNPRAPLAGNPLAVTGSNLPFPDTIEIKGLSITLKKVGYADNKQELAEVCLTKI